MHDASEHVCLVVILPFQAAQDVVRAGALEESEQGAHAALASTGAVVVKRSGEKLRVSAADVAR